MVLIDSCGWIAWLVKDVRGAGYDARLRARNDVLVPTLVLSEVARWVERERDEATALEVIALMREGHIADLDAATASLAAQLGLRHRLATADAIVYAHAQAAGIELWTSDAHFAGLPGVHFVT